MSPKLRAYWFEKQGLGGSVRGAPPHEVLEKTGWARSVGGANPYLALFARAGTSREEADSVVRNVHIHELPAARGCTYVAPSRDFGLALRMGRGEGNSQELSVARKWLGVTDAEIEKLQHEVLEALRAGPMDPKEIRAAVGDAVRSLGDEGKKRGQTTTLPLALGLLQADGHIRRIPVDGRLDQQRYKYARWDPSPMEGYFRSLEESQADFARLYFTWIGPATKSAFQAVSGLGVKAAERAIADLGLIPIDDDNPFLILPSEREAFESFRHPADPQYALASGLDNLSHLHWGYRNLIDESELGRSVWSPKGPASLGSLSDLESHPIYDRGRLAGLWEFDPASAEIVWMSFDEPNEDLRAAVRRMEAFARTLGDVRSFSLDSPESRKPRIEALRASRG